MNDWFNVTHGLNLSKQDLVDLLRGATKDQLFLFNGQLYEQTDGVAMGSPLGPLLANVFMCSIEETLERDGKMPAYYRRYVDDTLTIVPNIASANEFLETLNHCHPSVKFTMEIENNGMLPFLGTQLLNKSTQIQTKVYVKPTNTGLLLHYKSHDDDRYKRGLLKTMLDRAFRLSSNWSYFSDECDWLKMVFSRLSYPDRLINSTISRFIAVKASDQPVLELPAVNNELKAVPVVLPFKDQSSADIVRAQLRDLSQKIQVTVRPVFVSHKIKQYLKPREVKPPIVNQQSLVYQFKCDLCDAGYVGYTRRHLHQRVDEHKNASSSIGKHFRVEHSYVPNDLTRNFTILTKSKSKFDCLIYEMFLINEPSETKPECTVRLNSCESVLIHFYSSMFLTPPFVDFHTLHTFTS